ncbi:MAG: hypothetical protein ACTSSH_11950, partial [Candidatus Heimdallarchaeota archaeon]
MKKSLKIILVVGIIAAIAATSVGLGVAFTPTSDSELEVVNVTTQSNTDTVNLVLTCEGNQSGNTFRHRRNYANMHQLQFKLNGTEEVVFEEQYQWQFRHRVQNGQNMMYQFHVEGLEQGQVLQLRIEYNNGKVLQYTF